ncbi:MAG: phytanoyl-CoA dioxygenase family protein, partial [Candidatus Eremiobacterota bacterium]
MGRLPRPEILRIAHAGPQVECCVPAGGAVLMRPLLIHASSAARTPGHRRVIHLEFADWSGSRLSRG